MLYTGMLRQKFRDSMRIFLMLAHADWQRFNATQCKPGIEGPRNCPSCVLVKFEVLVQVFLVCNDRATNDITVPIDVLRRAVHDNICTKIKGLKEVGSSERIINNKQNVVSVR